MSKLFAQCQTLTGALGNRVAISVTAIAVVFSCVWGVARFDLGLHQFLWFQAAYDEPFYLWLGLHAPLSLDNRLVGRFLAMLLQAIGVSKFDWIALAYQVIFPPLVFVCAFVMTRYMSSRTITRLALMLLLCLAFDLLSGSSQVVAGVDPPALKLARFVGIDWLLRPDLMDFFVIFRRPEPQVSFSFLFLYLFGIIRSLEEWRPRCYRVVCLASPFTCLIYINVAVIGLLVFSLSSVAAGILYRWPLWKWFFGTVIATAIAYAIVFTGSGTQRMAALVVFPTHLLTLRPSLVWSILGLALCAVLVYRHGWRVKPRLSLAIALLIVPFATLNQQLITGRAILAQNWELNGNYVCIVAALGLMLPWLTPKAHRPAVGLSRYVPVLAWAVLIGLLVRGQFLNERFFALPNLQSVAHAQVYRQAVAEIGPVDRVVLPHLWDESLFVTRIGSVPPVLGGYNWLLANSPPEWGFNESVAEHLTAGRANAAVGFQTLARRGLTIDAFRKGIGEEVASQVCWPTLMYFFSLRDCWPVLSNYQSPNLARLAAAAGPLANEYASFLDRFRTNSSRERVLVIAYNALPDTFPESLLKNRLVAKTTLRLYDAEVTAYAYLQSVKPELDQISGGESHK
jgi:hypothetical protein